MVKSGIYMIQNLVNHKIYVGSTKNLMRRRCDHLGKLRKNIHTNQHLQSAFNQYGEDNFLFEVLEYVEDVNLLLAREKIWFEATSCCDRECGYNILANPYSGVGYQHSEESCIYMGLRRLGEKRSDETKARMSAAQKGHFVSEETKLKISTKAKERANTEKGHTFLVLASNKAKEKKLLDKCLKKDVK
jgi:group I intron endonuclease